MLRQCRPDLVFGNEAERQLVTTGLATAGDFDFTQQHRVRGITKTHTIGQMDLLDGRALASEPAAVLQPVGQDVLLQRTSRRGFEQFFHAFFQHQRGEVRQALCRLHVPARHLVFGRQDEPIEAIRGQGQEKIQLSDRRECITAKHLHRHHADVGRQVQLSGLRTAGHVGHAQNDFVLAVRPGEFPGVGQNPAVARRKHFQRAAPERLRLLAHREHAPGPVQQRMRVAGLGFDVDREVAVLRVHDRRQHQAGRVGAGKASVAVDRPLHRRAHTVAVTEVDVIAHADFIAVVQRRRARHRQQQAVEQFHPASVPLHQGRQSPTNPQVDPRPTVGRVVVPQVIAFLVGDHFQGQFIVIAQENRPLAIGGNLRGLAQNVGDREAIFLGQRHVHARHQRKVKGHVAFVAVEALFVCVAEIQLRVFGPLIGLGQQHAVGVIGVDFRADLLEDVVGLGQVFVVGAVALDQVRDRVQAQTVDAHVEPVTHYRQHCLHDLRVIEVQVRLVGIETVPEILAGDRVPGPIGLFGIEKDDARAVVLLIVIGPHVEIPRRRTFLGLAGTLEPGVLVRSVVDDQFGDHPQAAFMRLGDKALGVRQGAVVAVDAAILGDVVAIVAPWRGVERQEPDGVDAEVGNVIKLGDQAGKIADPVIVGVKKRFDMNLIDHCVLVPERVLDEGRCLGFLRHWKLLSNS